MNEASIVCHYFAILNWVTGTGLACQDSVTLVKPRYLGKAEMPAW